jgi:MFS family permease
VLYPLYAERWDLTPFLVTAVFATYQLTLIVVLPLFGGLSDRFGRRIVLIGAALLIAASGVLFAAAPHVAFLFAGRVLQGAGTALGMGAGTAALLDNRGTRTPLFASSTATVSTAMGLTAALIISGVVAEYLPLPTVWGFVVLVVLALAVAVLLVTTPDDRPIGGPRWRPQLPELPRGMALVFWLATLSLSLAYCAGAIFLAMGAQMISAFAITDSILVVGLLLGSSTAVIGLTGVLIAGVPATMSIGIGAVLALVNMGLMAGVAEAGSVSLFLVSSLVGGMAYAFGFSGGLGLLGAVVPPDRSGAILSTLYLVAYVLQAIAALGTGALATAYGMRAGIILSAAVMCVMCALVAVLLLVHVRRARQPARSV